MYWNECHRVICLRMQGTIERRRARQVFFRIEADERATPRIQQFIERGWQVVFHYADTYWKRDCFDIEYLFLLSNFLNRSFHNSLGEMIACGSEWRLIDWASKLWHRGVSNIFQMSRVTSRVDQFTERSAQHSSFVDQISKTGYGKGFDSDSVNFWGSDLGWIGADHRSETSLNFSFYDNDLGS